MKFSTIRPAKEQALHARMRGLGIRGKDLKERFIHARGHGGQNVNKVSTAVYLKHLPTGIEVKVDKDRSQGVNRFLARRLLVERLEKEILGKRTAQEIEAEKICKQKARRKRKGKRRYLSNG